jgi:hypothetical protein
MPDWFVEKLDRIAIRPSFFSCHPAIFPRNEIGIRW